MTVTIVDYDAGNLRSLANAIVRAGGEPNVASTPEQILAAERLILPGVGAAGRAITRLHERGLDQALTEAVRRQGVPMLGICLGMQLLAEKLHEYGEHAGLGWIRGEVVNLRALNPDIGQVPHTGWNEIETDEKWADVFGVRTGSPFYYFNHSYALSTDDTSVVAARTDHAGSIVAAIVHENFAATQFHPEISQKPGRQLLSRFLNWAP
jgi:imidazole glycerol-phosphate synthase subunit HisH